MLYKGMRMKRKEEDMVGLKDRQEKRRGRDRQEREVNMLQ